jgi:transposase
MTNGHPEDMPNPDQLLARLIEIEALVARQRAALNALETERNHFKGAFEEADAERQRLELVVRQLVRAQFGRKSERLDPEQFQLTLENIEQEVAAAKTAQQDAEDSHGKRRHRRAPAQRHLGHLPAHLERCEVLVDIADRVCPCGGGALHQIGIEETERLDAVPLHLRVRVIRRPVYGCRHCTEALVQAAAPDSAIPGGLPTEALLAHVAVSKYNDGLPLYRQAQILERDGVHLDRATLSDWMGRTAWWLKPLWERLLGSVLSSPKLFCDDTRLPVLAPGQGRTRIGYLWGLARDDSPWQGDLPPALSEALLRLSPSAQAPLAREAVAYVYTEDRVWDRAREVLADYTGVLQVDGWGGFKRLTGKQDAVLEDAGTVTLAFCWSHGRRQFFDIHQSSPSPIAGEVLRRIAELYGIEDEIRGQPPDTRQAVRQDRSRPRVDALKVYLEEQLARVSGTLGRRGPNAGGQGDPLHAEPLERAVRLSDRWPGRVGHQHHRAPASDRGNHQEERPVRRGRLRCPVVGDLHRADPERQDERSQPVRIPEGRARAHRVRRRQSPSTRMPTAVDLEGPAHQRPSDRSRVIQSSLRKNHLASLARHVRPDKVVSRRRLPLNLPPPCLTNGVHLSCSTS